jgi:hypothetical protein
VGGGVGRYTWPEQTTYQGEWKNGREDGRGLKKWTDNESYDGSWRGGLRHGRGRAVFGAHTQPPARPPARGRPSAA